MKSDIVPVSVLEFLKELKSNNNREWFEDHKARFKKEQREMKALFEKVFIKLQSHDEVDQFKVFRIYRDVRFSKDKTPYKSHFAASFHRAKPRYRGGYYLHIEPGNTFMAAGFWNPEKDDLFRIRKEFEIDDKPMREILASEAFRETFKGLVGEELKTAPKGFDKDHPSIDLIRKKQFIVTRKFEDKEVVAHDFLDTVDSCFKQVRPWFNYMSDVLTTDLNGVSLLE